VYYYINNIIIIINYYINPLYIMFTKILLPISLFIIIQIYICSLDVKTTEEIIANNDNKLDNYIKLMKNKSEITILMVILIIIYSTFGGLLSLF